MLACRTSNLQLLEGMLALKADTQLKDFQGLTALHMAAAYANPNFIRKLLQINEPQQEPPSFWSWCFGHQPVPKGANVDLRSENGRTPLMLACMKNKVENVKLLLDLKADPSMTDMFGETPLIQASAKGNLEVVQLLLSVGSKLNHTNFHSCSALWLAAQNGHCAVVQLLITHKADANQKGKNQATPLIIAVQNARMEVVKLLLEQNADLKLRTKSGLTALDWAITKRLVLISLQLHLKNAPCR